MTPQDSRAYLRLSSLSDLTVDLSDSKIVFAGGFLQGIAIIDCGRVTLANFEVDFLNLPYTEVELKAVDPDGRRLSYTTLPHWPDPATLADAAPPFVSVALWAVAFRRGDIVPGTSRMPVTQPIAPGTLALLQDNAPWTQSATLATLEPGDTIVVAARGGQHPITVFKGQEITIADATIRGSSAVGVALVGVSHSSVEDVSVIPRPGALISTNADGIHFFNSGPDNHIRRSFVTRTLDDALAIDALDLATVTGQTGPRAVTVTRTIVANGLDLPEGTNVDFVDPVSAQEAPGGIVVSETPQDLGSLGTNVPVNLVFDRDLPVLAAGAGMAFADPAQRGEGSSIEENEVEDILFGRGVWIGGAEGVNVKRNRVGRTSNGGIVVSQDTRSFPGPPARNVTIVDNVVRHSLGPMASGTSTVLAVGAIIVESTNGKSPFSLAAPNTDISILRNEIVESGRTGIWVGELDRGEIADNIIDGWDRHPELPIFGVNAQVEAQLRQDFAQPLVVRNSRDVDQHDNHADTEPDAAIDAPR